MPDVVTDTRTFVLADSAVRMSFGSDVPFPSRQLVDEQVVPPGHQQVRHLLREPGIILTNLDRIGRPGAHPSAEDSHREHRDGEISLLSHVRLRPEDVAQLDHTRPEQTVYRRCTSCGTHCRVRIAGPPTRPGALEWQAVG